MVTYRVFSEGTEGSDLNDLALLLSDRSIDVLWKHAETLMMKTKEKGVFWKTSFYVFYQSSKDELEYETNDFKAKLEIAKKVINDERYMGNPDKEIKPLKNQKQRELFLLSEYFLSSRQAQDVIELAKPEMRFIIDKIDDKEKVISVNSEDVCETEENKKFDETVERFEKELREDGWDI